MLLPPGALRYYKSGGSLDVTIAARGILWFVSWERTAIYEPGPKRIDGSGWSIGEKATKRRSTATIAITTLFRAG
jgi:hypothetical protein